MTEYVWFRGIDVTAITSSMIGGQTHNRACLAVSAMMSKGSINPADVIVLHTAYTSPDPPPVEMIRNPSLISQCSVYFSLNHTWHMPPLNFLFVPPEVISSSAFTPQYTMFVDLFLDVLFKPGVKINPEYRSKYLHILAYACTVAETYKKVPYSIDYCHNIILPFSSSAPHIPPYSPRPLSPGYPLTLFASHHISHTHMHTHSLRPLCAVIYHSSHSYFLL